MTTESAPSSTKGLRAFNRIGYGLFVLMSVYYMLRHEPNEALPLLGIALVFDPFNPACAWSARPLYQKAWLIVHLFILFLLLGYVIGQLFV